MMEPAHEQKGFNIKPLSIQIITTHKNAHIQKSILETWLRNFSDYCFYTDYTTGIGNQLELTTNSEYDSGGEKHILNLQRIYREKLFNQYEWFYFCDDDTVPNIRLILDFLNTANKSCVYGIWGYNWADDKTLNSLFGGAGYLVSGEILSKYSPPNLKQICWSDVQFSLWLRENEIPIVTTPEFKNYSPYHYGFDLTTISGVEQVRNSMSFHYVKDNWLREGIVSAYEMDPSKLENIN